MVHTRCLAVLRHVCVCVPCSVQEGAGPHLNDWAPDICWLAGELLPLALLLPVCSLCE